MELVEEIGAPGATRTPDHLVRRQVLTRIRAGHIAHKFMSEKRSHGIIVPSTFGLGARENVSAVSFSGSGADAL
jgi:hypothetical protein